MGAPLKVLVDKFSHMRFEPSGFTNNKEIPIAKSICDYIFRWLGRKFLPPEDQPHIIVPETTPLGNGVQEKPPSILDATPTIEKTEKQIFQTQSDAPPCHECGSIMVRNGTCYKCLNCGATSGCS